MASREPTPPSRLLLPSKSLRLVEERFEEYALLGQDILGSRESWDKVLALVPEHILLPSSSCLSLCLGKGLAAVGACMFRAREACRGELVPVLVCTCSRVDTCCITGSTSVSI